MDAVPLRGRRQSGLALAVLLGPTLVVLFIGLVLPTLQTGYASLRNADGSAWVGLRNFGWALSDGNALTGLMNSLTWTVVVPVAATALGLAAALMLQRQRSGSVPGLLLLWPLAVSYVAAGTAWGLLYQDLSLPWSTLLLTAVMIWIQSGFAMVLLGLAIAGIPADVVEAATLDGAVGWRRLVAITLPMIGGRIVVVLTTIAVVSWKVFDIVRTTTDGADGTAVVATQMYRQAFDEADAGRGSALAIILLIGVIPLVAFNARRVRDQVVVRAHRVRLPRSTR